jgi:hypothetical protein
MHLKGEYEVESERGHCKNKGWRRSPRHAQTMCQHNLIASLVWYSMTNWLLMHQGISNVREPGHWYESNHSSCIPVGGLTILPGNLGGGYFRLLVMNPNKCPTVSTYHHTASFKMSCAKSIVIVEVRTLCAYITLNSESMCYTKPKITTMNFLKGNTDNTGQTQEVNGGGGGLMGKMNNAMGGGQSGEKNKGKADLFHKGELMADDWVPDRCS